VNLNVDIDWYERGFYATWSDCWGKHRVLEILGRGTAQLVSTQLAQHYVWDAADAVPHLVTRISIEATCANYSSGQR
jgi:hypothetical protein